LLIPITVRTRDASTGAVLDAGIDTVNFLTGAHGVQLERTISAGKAIIDVSNSRFKFADGSMIDRSPTLAINGRVAGVYNRSGIQFQLSDADSIDIMISGDLTGIKSLSWASFGRVLSTADLANRYVNLSVAGNDPALMNAAISSFQFIVDGNTALVARTLTAGVNLKLDAYSANNRNLVPSNTAVTVWELNGTMLTAHWVNGNNSFLNSRIYLWNPGSAGEVWIQVYTLPNGTGGSTLLGTLSWGTLRAASAANIKLAEDILGPLGIPLPYIDDGGNLMLVITVRAPGVSGISQTFSGTFAYGTYPLK
jgi:hypothetical protein